MCFIPQLRPIFLSKSKDFALNFDWFSSPKAKLLLSISTDFPLPKQSFCSRFRPYFHFPNHTFTPLIRQKKIAFSLLSGRISTATKAKKAHFLITKKKKNSSKKHRFFDDALLLSPPKNALVRDKTSLNSENCGRKNHDHFHRFSCYVSHFIRSLLVLFSPS